MRDRRNHRDMAGRVAVFVTNEASLPEITSLSEQLRNARYTFVGVSENRGFVVLGGPRTGEMNYATVEADTADGFAGLVLPRGVLAAPNAARDLARRFLEGKKPVLAISDGASLLFNLAEKVPPARAKSAVAIAGEVYAGDDDVEYKQALEAFLSALQPVQARA